VLRLLWLDPPASSMGNDWAEIKDAQKTVLPKWKNAVKKDLNGTAKLRKDKKIDDEFRSDTVRKCCDMAGALKYKESKDMTKLTCPDGCPYYTPVQTETLKSDGVNCVAQSIYLAGLLNSLKGQKSGKPPIVYLVTFRPLAGGHGHAVLGLVCRKDLHGYPKKGFFLPPTTPSMKEVGLDRADHLDCIKLFDSTVSKDPESPPKGFGDFLDAKKFSCMMLKIN